MKTKVKICGLTNSKDIVFASLSGADFIGLVFVKNHRHYLTPQEAIKIIPLIQKRRKVVGIFVNENLEAIKQIADSCKLDYVQLHGQESPDFCNRVNEFTGVMKTFCFNEKITANQVVETMKQYNVDYYIIDREKQGSGKMVDLSLVTTLANSFPIFLAGGLTPNNVKNAVLSVRSYGVDVSSGIETNGVPDREKIKLFIKNVKGI